MFWVLPYGGSTFVEGKETGESGLEQFLQVESPPDKLISDTKLGAESIIGDTKTEKNIEEPSVLSAPPISRLTGECSEKKEIEESSNIMNKSFEHLSWVSNEKQMSTARPNSSESCPMKLLMQHVSSQGESTAQTSSTELKSKDLKFNNHHVSQTPVINRNHHSVIVSSASDVKSSDDLQNRTSVDPDDPPMPWFRLLPREPCDSTTVINCWMPRRSLDGSAHRKPGRPTKSPTITASEACAHTSTIQTNIDELETPVTPQSFYSLPSLPRPLTLDEVRLSVMESLRQDPASIPKGLSNCSLFSEASQYSVLSSLIAPTSGYVPERYITFRNVLFSCTSQVLRSVLWLADQSEWNFALRQAACRVGRAAGCEGD